MNKPRVLLVLNRFRPMIGGAEKQCELLCENLKEEVEWVGILTHRYSNDLAVTDHVAGVRVYRLGRSSLVPKIALLYFYIDLIKRAWIIRHQYDLIHCHTAGLTGLLLAIFGKNFNKPVLLKLTAEGELIKQIKVPSEDGNFIVKFKRQVIKFLANSGVGCKSTYLVALTEGGAKEGRMCSIPNIYMIPNGVEINRFHKKNKKIKDKKLPIKFGYAGRLTSEKGTHLLADVFREIFQTEVSVQLFVAGTGERQLNSSQEILEKLRIDYPDKVFLLGSIPETADFLSEIDIYISASTYEGLPNAVLEAIASGLPCILSDIEGHREVGRINTEAYIKYFPPGDVDNCVSVIKKLASDEKLPESKLSHELNIDNVAKRYLNLYNKIIARECNE